ncbi:hypothetical protein [Deminuibacter soli]|uniref:Uncharacterized protein n=1 Tax=Deminuibacter soli TaxID=2291815 RepID=A0A3E1NCT9_9BACT|nr:hypothetical protein [Deminuibacter soli]RFM25647.1 hypothetical protein DXN05_23855 [Deminuibacter soli]
MTAAELKKNVKASLKLASENLELNNINKQYKSERILLKQADVEIGGDWFSVGVRKVCSAWGVICLIHFRIFVGW